MHGLPLNVGECTVDTNIPLNGITDVALNRIVNILFDLIFNAAGVHVTGNMIANIVSQSSRGQVGLCQSRSGPICNQRSRRFGLRLLLTAGLATLIVCRRATRLLLAGSLLTGAFLIGSLLIGALLAGAFLDRPRLFRRGFAADLLHKDLQLGGHLIDRTSPLGRLGLGLAFLDQVHKPTDHRDDHDDRENDTTFGSSQNCDE